MSKRKLLFTFLRIAVTVGLLAFVFSSIDCYDSVKMKDSATALKGTVVNRAELLDKTAGEVVLRDSDGGERRIAMSDVVVEARVKLSDGVGLAGRVVSETAEKLEIVDSEGAQHTVWFEESGHPTFIKEISRSYYSRGFFSIVSTIDVWLFVFGVLLYGVINFTGVVRWQILMRVQGIGLSFWRSTKLTFLGLFYNNIMPGMAGGDVLKAYYAARETSRKTSAVVAVFFDRLIGLLGLALLAAITILINYGDRRFHGVAEGIAIFIAVVAVGAIFIFSHRLRRLIRFKKIMRVVPFASVRRILKEIDNAIFIYRSHKKAVLIAILISLFGHSFMITACYVFSRAIGIEVLTIGDCFVFLPAVFMIMSIPISMAGWGLAENSFGWLLSAVGVSLGESTTMGVLYNLTRTLWSLPGALAVLALGRRPSAGEIEREMKALDREMQEVAGEDG